MMKTVFTISFVFIILTSCAQPPIKATITAADWDAQVKAIKDELRTGFQKQLNDSLSKIRRQLNDSTVRVKRELRDSMEVFIEPVVGEIAGGKVDSINKTFTFAFIPVPDMETVFVAGRRLVRGKEYKVTTSTIPRKVILEVAPKEAPILDYYK